MIVAIADTHAVIWYLFSDPRLGKAASAFIDHAIANGNHVGVSAITIAEMVYLVEKARIPQSAVYDLHAAISDPNAVLQYVPLDENVAIKMIEIPRQDVPDLPDRIIAASASFYSVPLLTRDERIKRLSFQTIW
ncbi:MAG TPA: PIN domain-containing protein [Bryobacteraceae bacterium]|nr:PIN domain-containing protein [Bryobacteraceae bacterium]